MSVYRAFLAALIAIVLPVPALAATEHDEINFTGPLVTAAVDTLPVGMLNVEPYLIYTNATGSYDNDGNRHAEQPSQRQWQVALPITYGLTENLSLQVTLNAVRNAVGGMHSDGMRMGDTSVRLQARVKAPAADGTGLVLAVSAQQRLRTGQYQQLDNNPLNGTGTGATQSTLAFGAQQLIWLPNNHALRWRAQVAWSPSPGHVSLRGVSVYSTPGGFEGYAGLGQAWSASVAAEYVLTSRWVLVGEAIWNHSSSARINGTKGGQATYTLLPGQAFSLAPAVEYNFSPKVGLIAGVQFTVGGRNTLAYVAPQIALNMAF